MKEQLSMFEAEEVAPLEGRNLSPPLGPSPEGRTLYQPLAARMRPRNLDEYVGQSQLLGPGKPLRLALDRERLFASMIFFGPPGTGKTTLARLLAARSGARFEMLSAVTSGVKDLREVVERASVHQRSQTRTILFIDEIHRFNKSQQDALLPHVEEGLLTLIGATTENPYFEVNRALLSRSKVFPLQALTLEEVRSVLAAALNDPERGYGKLEVQVETEVLDFLAEMAGGDARAALNSLEFSLEASGYDSQGRTLLTLASAEAAIGRKHIPYDKKGDYHYDVISAFIKSVRGSDAQAALFWLARMVLAGEDLGFIVRRLLILAAEDVGLADPNAILVTAACAQAIDRIGLPEAKYHLAQATIYLACAPKSHSLGAYFKAEAAAQAHVDSPVPIHLRDSHYQGAQKLGHGRGYLYPHDYPLHYVEQRYLPDSLGDEIFYQPGGLGFERKIAAWLKEIHPNGEEL